VGEQAYTQDPAGSALSLQFLARGTWVQISLRLRPYATMDDLPYLAELGSAVAGRL
jgi:hypothetical protein